MEFLQFFDKISDCTIIFKMEEQKRYKLNSGKEILIRPALIEDSEKLLEYLTLVGTESDYLSYGENEFDFNLEYMIKSIELSQRRINFLSIVALFENEIIGSLDFKGGSRPRIAHTGIMGITVKKNYWKSGVGNCLMDYLFRWAKSTNIVKKVDLRVRTNNYPAIKLYIKYGFIVIGKISRCAYVNNRYVDEYYMERWVE